MFDLNAVGVHIALDAANHAQARFGVYLPNIHATDGYSVQVRIIHERDQFTPEIPPKDFALAWQDPSDYDLWTTTVDITANADPASHFGQPGTYVYRYQLIRNGQVVTLWFTDPVARAAGIGELAAFTVPDPAVPAAPFPWTDADFIVSDLDDLVVYELQVEEFNDTFEGVGERLDYLQGLGVNALELMPVTSVIQEFDWGYGPLHYFAPLWRCGGEHGLKTLIDQCHARNIAVILDSVYDHVNDDFPYNRVYVDSGVPSPFIGHFAEDGKYGPEADFAQAFTRDFFLAVNTYWLQEYHVDGFRYDFVPGYYDGATGQGYADLVYQTYQTSLPMARFRAAGSYSRILQVAEDLDNPVQILTDTYTDATWQDNLLNTARGMAQHGTLDSTFGGMLENFVHLLDPSFGGTPYPATKQMNGVDVPVAPFQYLESHDHDFFITCFGTQPGIGGPGDVEYGIRSNVYEMQPYVIALTTCQGVPMLWEGQEFADNYTLPPGGNARISFRRSMHWEYFYDAYGQPLIRLYRILGNLRRTCRALRSRESFYYNQQSQPTNGVVAYHRRAAPTATDPEQIAMVFLNFSNAQQTLNIPFPKAGVYRERIDDPRPGGTHLDITVVNDGDAHDVIVPSHYGAIYVMPA